MMRRVSIALGIVIATITIFALALPSDATKEILALRGHFGTGEAIATQRDEQSVIREVALRSERGEVLTNAWIRRPVALKANYRVVMTYAGANTGDAILQLIPARDDLVVVAVQYPWKPPHTFLSRVSAIYDIRQAAYRTVAGGIVAVDFITRNEHLDPHRIILLGASLGSIFATIHGAIDQRVQQVVLIHGGADLAGTLGAEIRRVPKWLRWPLVSLARIPIATFDPAQYVSRIAPRHLLMIAARDDWRFPPEAIVAFFNVAREPKELRWTKTVHVGARNRRVVETVIAELNAYLDAAR